MRCSQAFAALKSQVIAEMLDRVHTELVPHFNAEIEDIVKVWEKERPVSEALADHKKRARIADLVLRRDSFIESLNNEMRLILGGRIKEKEYEGKVAEAETDDDHNPGKKRKVLEITFKDGSKARLPQRLWLDYRVFARV